MLPSGKTLAKSPLTSLRTRSLYSGERQKMFFQPTPASPVNQVYLVQLNTAAWIIFHNKILSARYRNVCLFMFAKRGGVRALRKNIFGIPRGGDLNSFAKHHTFGMRPGLHSGFFQSFSSSAACTATYEKLFIDIDLGNNNMVKPHGRLVLVG